MNVNLSSRDLLDSYNQVLSGDPQCEWTIFTYGGGTMDLKVQADGSGGLEELKEEFMDGRIQYAFIRITDENSGLPKFVQINWCGDGVPESKKGLFNNHSSTVARFFKAAHMQVNARNEDDINPSLIKKRLAEAGGAAYSVHKESQSRSSGGGGGGGGHERIAPVGSSYQPIKVDMGALRSGAKKDVIEPVGSSYVPTKANVNPTPAPVQATRSIPPPQQAARPTPPPAQAQAPAKAVDDDDTWGEEPPAVGARPAFVASSPAAKPAYVAPQTSFYKPPPPKVEAPTPAPAPAKPAADDKIGPVGTAYTPVSLPAPKKLASRWGQPAASEESAPPKPSYGGGASRFGGAGAVGGAGGGEKKLTWSERQAQAKARDAEEEKGSLAATAAVVGTTVASGASKVASSLPSFPARSTPPAPKAPAPESDDGFDEPDAPPPAPPLASRPPPPQASAAPSFPDEDDFDEPDAPPPPPPAPVARAPIVNAAPSFPDDDDFDDDEPPAIPPPPPSAPVAAVAAVVAAPVESAKKAYESIKETLVGPSETKVEEAGAGGGKRAKVLFDYEATEDNELALREGEILVELEMVDEGWWSAKGEKGDVGLFPANYVELLEDDEAEAEQEEAPPPPPPAAPSPPPRAPTPEPEPEAAGEDQGTVATALYDYDAAESNELSFKEGDRIHSIEEASEDWWSGVAPSGETGLFPANYVEVQK